MTRAKPLPAAERCAVRADERGDEMLGTAFPAARLLLVEQPFPWGFEGLRTSRFDREIALELEARGRTVGVRIQAIRRPGPYRDGHRRRWAFVDTRDPSRSMTWGDFGEDRELLVLPLDGSRGEPDPSPVFLVCTHGRHDACCAGRGRPVLAGLEAAAPGRVWQSSHLGGCRFAPTVLVLPSGQMYGRVPAADAGLLVESTGTGEVISELSRGRIGIPPAAQAAMGFAHDHLALPLSTDVRLVSTTTVDKHSVVVRVASVHGHHDITVRRDRVDASGLTCGAPGPSAFVAHRPVSIEPVSGSG